VTPIAIPDDVLREIYAHAIAAFPDECCGYLVGRTPDAVDAAVPCRNAQADGGPPVAPELGPRGADTGFAIAGDELFRFARSFDGDRPPRIVYHSHTNGAAYFSALDRQLAAGPAYPVQHVVIGVAAHVPQGFPRATESPAPPAIDPSPSVMITEIAQFAWSDAGGDYVEVARWTAERAAP